MEKGSKIYLAGHTGLVGAALMRELKEQGYENIVTRTRSELDLTRQAEVEEFFRTEKPRYVFLAAARVGGIYANSTYPAEFIYENLAIQTNVIHSAYKSGVEKLLFLGTACAYPRECPQPIKEEYLMCGPLEPTNVAFGTAKVAGEIMCQSYDKQYGTDFIIAVPTNLYGPGDNFDPKDAHVIPALMRRFHEAKAEGAPSISVWGTGSPRREFMYIDDCARACIFLMENYDSPELINVGTGEDCSIGELASTIKEVVGYEGELEFDTSKPDGAPLKMLDSSRLLSMGWKPETSLREGLERMYRWFLDNPEMVRSGQ
jgi:GDP-L-fucose synthase